MSTTLPRSKTTFAASLLGILAATVMACGESVQAVEANDPASPPVWIDGGRPPTVAQGTATNGSGPCGYWPNNCVGPTPPTPPKPPRTPPCQPNPVDSPSMVVVEGADDNPHCDVTRPCGTIAHAIERAHAVGLDRVFVAKGTYRESIVLRAGITIDAGWGVQRTVDWQCRTASTDVANLVSGDPVAVLAKDLGGTSTISGLAIRVSSVSPGANVIGILALGSSTSLVLKDVTVAAANAPDGAAGLKGQAGTGGADDCPPSTGAAGVNEGAAGAVAPDVLFGSEGIVAGVATTGTEGAAGAAGPAGTKGACVACLSSCSGSGTCTTATLRQCGDVGKSGCGGSGGRGGEPGMTGGSSVALYAWDARVQLEGGALSAGHGGNGGRGGDGGDGGQGGVGATGHARPTNECYTSCSDDGTGCTATNLAVGVGGSGSTGGSGGSGGSGGCGAGGASFAIVRGGAALVSYDPSKTLLGHGNAGVSPLGVPGVAGDVGP